MHLTKLELQGFKTFAKKTSLSFLGPKNDRSPITAIVGPNGSGKSNLADAIRWVLGEQSLKLLRGKKSEDIIFSGSQGKGRSGFAEVIMTMDNSDSAMPIDYSEVTITRRLFRDGTSEYLLNEGTVRLIDIQLLLAQANVGQRSYSVIGQGMIDHVLVSTPEERKAFFDDATGVKPFQIKRHDAMLKLIRTHENLSEVKMILREIEPRLRSLKRQANRLEQRKEIETALFELEAVYYGNQWWKLADDLTKIQDSFQTIDNTIKTDKKELKLLEQKVDEIEKTDLNPDEGLTKLQEKYKQLRCKRDHVRDELFETEKNMELARVRAQSNWAPLPLLKIVEEIEEVVKGLRRLKGLKGPDDISKAVDALLERSQKLSKSLQHPNPEDIKPDPKALEKINKLKADEQQIYLQITALEKEMDGYATKEKTERTELIEKQKLLRDKSRQVHLLENQRNELQIELARLVERRQALKREMDEFMKERATPIRLERSLSQQNPTAQNGEQIYPEIQRLRYKLELIGGIDPEAVKEYSDIKDRFEFMDGQVQDLETAIKSTEKVIEELDQQIEKQSKEVFGKINKEFEHYFKMLFNGGSCQLLKLTREDLKNEEDQKGVSPDRAFADTEEARREKEDRITEKISRHQDPIIGIDIQATPPGKRVKELNLLSGGERALTSIALVCAIMAVNPAPFVVLDEVDAALDEANTLRFAAILDELSKKSQFIVITHNRATMEKADVLYGVTMGIDGISNLLSVHMEEIVKNGTARC